MVGDHKDQRKKNILYILTYINRYHPPDNSYISQAVVMRWRPKISVKKKKILRGNFAKKYFITQNLFMFGWKSRREE